MESLLNGRRGGAGKRPGAFIGGMLLLAMVTAAADEGQDSRVTQAVAMENLPAPAEAAVLGALGDARAIADDTLGSASAMARIEIPALVINDQEVSGTVQGNAATGNSTGNNSVADGAFAGSSGFATAIQNTGNNVLIQNSTIINVSLDP